MNLGLSPYTKWHIIFYYVALAVSKCGYSNLTLYLMLYSTFILSSINSTLYSNSITCVVWNSLVKSITSLSILSCWKYHLMLCPNPKEMEYKLYQTWLRNITFRISLNWENNQLNSPAVLTKVLVFGNLIWRFSFGKKCNSFMNYWTLSIDTFLTGWL